MDLTDLLCSKKRRCDKGAGSSSHVATDLGGQQDVATSGVPQSNPLFEMPREEGHNSLFQDLPPFSVQTSDSSNRLLTTEYSPFQTDNFLNLDHSSPADAVFVPSSVPTAYLRAGDIPNLSVGLSTRFPSDPPSIRLHLGNFRENGIPALGGDGSIASSAFLVSHMFSHDADRQAFITAAEDPSQSLRTRMFSIFQDFHYWAEVMTERTDRCRELQVQLDENRQELDKSREETRLVAEERRELADKLAAVERELAGARESEAARGAELQEKQSEVVAMRKETADKCNWFSRQTASIMADCFIEHYGDEVYDPKPISDLFRQKSGHLNEEGYYRSKILPEDQGGDPASAS